MNETRDNCLTTRQDKRTRHGAHDCEEQKQKIDAAITARTAAGRSKQTIFNGHNDSGSIAMSFYVVLCYTMSTSSAMHGNESTT
jgi:hypothetical protein